MNKLTVKLKQSVSVFTSLKLTELQCVFSFFLLASIMWGIALGNLPLRDWDEATRALVAREMYRTGNWLYPTFQGEPYLLKPPLMDWLIATSYHFGGVTEFTTRLPGAFFSACGVPLIYLVAKKIFVENLSAIFSACVYLTLLPVVRHGRLAMLDGMAVSFFLLLLFCLLKSCENRRWSLGVGLCLGTIAFTKGLLVVPLAVIAVTFLLVDKQVALLRSPYFWLCILLGNLPIFAWYIAQWQHYGTTFLQVHFHNQGLERISQAVEGHNRPPWFYLLELLKYTFPWLIFWCGGLSLAWQQRYTRWGALILIGTIGYLGVISVMQTKLPWYIMPLYPFFAFAVAAQLKKLWQDGNNYSGLLIGMLVLLMLVGLGGSVYFVLADPQPVLIVMGVVVTITMGICVWKAKQNNPIFIPILFGGMYLTLLLLMVSKSWVWELNEAFPVKPVAALIQNKTDAKAVVYTSFSYRRPSLDFYSNHRVIPADITTLQNLWSTQSYYLLNQPALAKLELPDSVTLGTVEGFTLVTHKLRT